MVDEVQMYTCMERGEKVHLPMLMHSGACHGFNSQFTDSNPGGSHRLGAWTVNGGSMGTAGHSERLCVHQLLADFTQPGLFVSHERVPDATHAPTG